MPRNFEQVNPNKGRYGEFDVDRVNGRFVLNVPGEPGLNGQLGSHIKNFDDAQRFIDFIRPEDLQA